MAFWNGKKPKESSRREIGVTTLLEDYDIVDVNPKGFIVVADKPKALVEPEGKVLQAVQDIKTTELGSGGMTTYGRAGQWDYNPTLRGWLGLRKWDEMRRGDGTVRSALRIVKTPVLAARWFVDPASPSKQDEKVADYVEDCLFKYMTTTWPQLLTEINLHLDFGYYAFEKVFDFYKGKVIWKKWAPRHPMTIYQWDYDLHGGVNGCWAFSETNEDGRVYIPIEDLLVFTNEKEAGNVEGISVLRSAYKHWFYADNLYKIDAIQKERHGIGVPVIKLPPNFNEDDKKAANTMGENLRTNEKAHIVLPPLWDVITLKIEGQQVDALASAKHHEDRILSSVLAQFLGAQGGGTAAEVKADLFNKSTRFIADQIRDVINRYAIPQLVDYNWRTVDTYPELRVRRIGESVDWQKISFAVRNFVGAGVIRPDDALEDQIREEMDLPKADPTTVREIATPQMPGGGGAAARSSSGKGPRQSQAGNMQQAQTPGSSRVGQGGANNQG